ncbi:MAG: extracellular solute-binding protein [Firmicutes bacterium]|jgi:multiple sugar transport system substrate-binding protein|nr:extracellular solute-binding protein [Bacillota bacterium]
MKRLALVLTVLLVVLLSLPVLGAEYDFNGRTIKIAGHVGDGMREYFADGEGRGRLEKVEEAFNVKIEFVQIEWDGAENRILTSILAGDPIGDLIYVSNRWLPLLAGNGGILPLDDVLGEEYYANLPGSHKNMRELYSSYQGKAYGISVNGSYQRNMDIGSAQGWIYNRDLFLEADLPTPNELQNEGKWNWDSMKELAIALTQDLDGDGVIDVYGVGARLDPWPIEQEMATYANGGGIIKFVDGKAVYAMNDPAAIEAIELWKELDQVHGAVMVGDQYDIRAEFNQGKVAMFRLDLYALPDHANQVDFDFGWVFFPMGPQAEDFVNPVWGFEMFVLPITCQEPEALVELVDMLFETTGNYRDLDAYEEEYVEYFLPYVKDWDSLDTIKEMLSKARLWDNVPGLANELNEALVKATMGSTSAKSEMDAVAPVIQSLLDEAYNQ